MLRIIPGVALFSFLILILSSGDCRAKDFKIQVSGNDRTNTGLIEKLAERCLENFRTEEVQSFDTVALEQCLLNSKLFSEVEISRSGDQIEFQVKDRWTLVPVPIIQVEKDQATRYGVFLLETNLLGFGKTLALGALVSETKSLFFTMYNDPNLFQSRWNFGITVGRDDNQVYRYQGEESVYGVDESASFLTLSLGYRLTSSFSGAIQYSSFDSKYENFEIYAKPEDYRRSFSGVELRWNDSKYRFYFQEGTAGFLRLMRQVARDDEAENNQVALLRFNWQIPVLRNQVLRFGLNGRYLGRQDEKDGVRVGTGKGFRGIPSAGAWVEEFSTVSLDYQVPLKSGPTGTVTIGPFVDFGHLKGSSNEDGVIDYNSIGIAMAYYLKQIAFPAVGFAMGRNSDFQKTFYRITIGFEI